MEFRKELLKFVYSKEASAVILDVSGIDIMDLEDFNALRDTMSAVKVLGAFPVISGLKPGVVASIVELGADIDGICAALDLDEAFQLIYEKRSQSQ